MLYGKKSIIKRQTKLSKISGLVDGPKLFSEHILCGQTRFAELRTIINESLKNGDIPDATLQFIRGGLWRSSQ